MAGFGSGRLVEIRLRQLMDLVVSWVVGCSLQSWAEEQGGPLKLEKCRLVKYHILARKIYYVLARLLTFLFFGMVYNLLYLFFDKVVWI